MRRRRPPIPQRTLHFVGCEGESERAYVALLQKLADSRSLHVHLHGELLKPGAGDPLSLVDLAIDRLKIRRSRGAHYRHVAILLDDDKSAEAPARSRQAIDLARRNDIRVVWQRPNFEAVLLRHLAGCAQLQPSADRSLAELQRHWPEYDKRGISAAMLARRIDFGEVAQAAAVEPDLAELLRAIGLV